LPSGGVDSGYESVENVSLYWVVRVRPFYIFDAVFGRAFYPLRVVLLEESSVLKSKVMAVEVHITLTLRGMVSLVICGLVAAFLVLLIFLLSTLASLGHSGSCRARCNSSYKLVHSWFRPEMSRRDWGYYPELI